MNPIEHVWDVLGRRAAVRQPPPQTLQKLESAVLEEWDKISQFVINSLIDSLPQSGISVLEADGIGNLIEEILDFARQIHLEVDSDVVQELLDSHNQEMMIINEQYSEKEFFDPVNSEDRMMGI
ncbi:transposable element Tcb2 transposase [Trichonephila clavipes]|nr:transposable element Tcb2 transposase [Trichonephila clavipes]